jgi:hypothetical protein
LCGAIFTSYYSSALRLSKDLNILKIVDTRIGLPGLGGKNCALHKFLIDTKAKHHIFNDKIGKHRNVALQKLTTTKQPKGGK